MMSDPFETVGSTAARPRWTRFIVVQLALWGCIHALVFPGYQVVPNARAAGASWGDIILLLSLSMALAVSGALALAWVYRQLVERWLQGLRGVLAVLGCSMVASVPWSLGILLYAIQADWSPSEEVFTNFVSYACAHARTMVGWSALWLVPMLAERVQATRENALRCASEAHGARLQAFQRRFNPHSLLTSLDAARRLMRRHPHRAEREILHLASTLRRAVDGAEHDHSGAPAPDPGERPARAAPAEFELRTRSSSSARASGTHGSSVGRFLLHQLAGWGVVVLLIFGEDMIAMVSGGVSPLKVARISACAVVLFVGCSLALDAIYRQLPARFLRGWRAVAAVLGACAVMSAPMAIFMQAVLVQVSGLPTEPPTVSRLAFFYAWLLVGWSGVRLPHLLTQRVFRTRERAVRTKALAQEAQLEALRSQLNPHFLFNSLNSVLELMAIDIDRADRMMIDVIDLLGRAMNATRTEAISVGEEVDFIQYYLRCEKVRFADCLTIHIDVPSDLRDEPIPSMILQPLVENALKHGMAGGEMVRLELEARRSRGHLLFEVRNTGQLTDGSSQDGRGGAGLRIVRQRIRTCYPRSGSVTLHQEELRASGEGAQVLARLAYDPSEPQAAEMMAALELAPGAA